MAGALRTAGLAGHDLAAIGITNQRETTVVWNPRTGQPWCNAIVWQDTRTDCLVEALEAASRAVVRAHRIAAIHLLLGGQAALDPGAG